MNPQRSSDPLDPYRGLVKPLEVACSAEVPAELAYPGLRAVAITRHDLREDVDGINASIDLIRRTRGGKWPTGPVTEGGNYLDLVWHECEFRDGNSYTYVLRDTDSKYLGCLYLYPVGKRTPLSAETIHHDVDVSWWVTPAAYGLGYYELVNQAVHAWFTSQDLPFAAPLFSNSAPSPRTTGTPGSREVAPGVFGWN